MSKGPGSYQLMILRILSARDYWIMAALASVLEQANGTVNRTELRRAIRSLERAGYVKVDRERYYTRTADDKEARQTSHAVMLTDAGHEVIDRHTGFSLSEAIQGVLDEMDSRAALEIKRTSLKEEHLALTASAPLARLAGRSPCSARALPDPMACEPCRTAGGCRGAGLGGQVTRCISRTCIGRRYWPSTVIPAGSRPSTRTGHQEPQLR
jgi:DNA-binding transcriptional regulator YhcF (GntR family)